MSLNDNKDKENERIVAMFSLSVAWLKIFDWLRLFETTSFYMRLVEKTLTDVSKFVIIFVVALGMIGSSMYMLQMSVPSGLPDDK